MDRPTVSIVTTCYGSGQYADTLRDAITSVRGQTMAAWEHIIVGDGLAELCVREMPHASLRFLPIRHHDYIEARNIGMAAARGRYVMALDADDQLAPMYLERLLATIDPSKEFAIARSHLQYIGAREGLGLTPAYDRKALMAGNISPIGSIFTRALWVAVGGYEVALFAYEDWCFWLACSKLNPTVTTVEEGLFRYCIHPSVGSAAARHHNVLVAMIQLIHADLYGDVRPAIHTLASMPEDAHAKVRKRLGWFPNNRYLQAFHRIATEGS